MPIRRLLDEGHEVCGFFFNPNIHPLSEYLRRRDGAAQVAEKCKIKMFWDVTPGDYDSIAWMRMVHGRERERCPMCWGQRLQRAYELAAAEGFDAFSTSLLYSRRQRHNEIVALADELVALAADLAGGASGKPKFLYRDFRADWQEGINISKEWGIYRQQYCGCLFSENERYARELAKCNEELNEELNDEPLEEQSIV